MMVVGRLGGRCRRYFAHSDSSSRNREILRGEPSPDGESGLPVVLGKFPRGSFNPKCYRGPDPRSATYIPRPTRIHTSAICLRLHCTCPRSQGQYASRGRHLARRAVPSPAPMWPAPTWIGCGVLLLFLFWPFCAQSGWPYKPRRKCPHAGSARLAAIYIRAAAHD